MALFGSNNTDENKKAEADSSDSQPTVTASGKPPQRIDNSRHDVLVKPHITEKATYLTDDGVYTFVVKESANKTQIKQAMKDVYGLEVKKVRTVNLPNKKVKSRRGEDGIKGGIKKAYVYLKEGDSIELM